MAKKTLIPDSFYYDGRKKRWKIENIQHGNIPYPNAEHVKECLGKWKENEKYVRHDSALDKLFLELCPYNADINDVLIKASALNNFYSTNLYDLLEVAKIIASSDLDVVLDGKFNPQVLDGLDLIIKDKTGRSAYSFLTKYFSHHKVEDYPIYDDYVGKLLKYYRDCEGFASFYNFPDDQLLRYKSFCRTINDFQKYYNLQQFTLKEIDIFLWQTGKNIFQNINNNKKHKKQQKNAVFY